MAIIEWNVPFSLISPAGTLNLQPSGVDVADGFAFVADQCDAGADLRFDSSGLPAGDGEAIRQSFDRGYTIRVTAEMYKDGAIATGADRREMFEELLLHLNAIKRADGRVQWTPTGTGDNRLLDRVRLIERPTGKGGMLKTATFALMSPFPYVIDATEVDTTITAGSTVSVTNNGNAVQWPVFQVSGPTSAFTITNHTAIDEYGNEYQVSYDDSLPGAVPIGGGDYAEIDCFRGVVTLNGDLAYRNAGIDWTVSDRIPLVPGPNLIELTGATALCKSNHAYA